MIFSWAGCFIRVPALILVTSSQNWAPPAQTRNKHAYDRDNLCDYLTSNHWWWWFDPWGCCPVSSKAIFQLPPRDQFSSSGAPHCNVQWSGQFVTSWQWPAWPHAVGNSGKSSVNFGNVLAFWQKETANRVLQFQESNHNFPIFPPWKLQSQGIPHSWKILGAWETLPEALMFFSAFLLHMFEARSPTAKAQRGFGKRGGGLMANDAAMERSWGYFYLY